MEILTGKGNCRTLVFLLFPAFLFIVVETTVAQNLPCKFDANTLQFIGTPTEQAKCLLRPNMIGGVLGSQLDDLPKPLGRLIGTSNKVKKEKLRAFLSKHSIDENDIGGSLDLPLSMARLPDGNVVRALYFIIHDASTPYLRDENFPLDMNTNGDWRGNKIDIWLNNPVAHVFVNRLGRSVTTATFADSVTKGWGTKFARDTLGSDGKGLQLHIELIQPRRRDPNSATPDNDRFAPLPGFTVEQYERLALLYVCAGVRRGTWLIPAYHSAIDAGIRNAHDDPQNFELGKFASSIESLLKQIE